MRAPHAALSLAAFNPKMECSGTGLKVPFFSPKQPMRAPHAAIDLAAFNPKMECSGIGLKDPFP